MFSSPSNTSRVEQTANDITLGYCGNTIANASALSSGCTYACTGATNEICGGSSAISVYYDPALVSHP